MQDITSLPRIFVYSAFNARPVAFWTFGFPRIENRVKAKLAFKNPKTGSMSLFR